jgi:hypothetical protein
MAEVNEYTSGKVLESIGKAFDVFESSEGPLDGSRVGRRLLENVGRLEPKKAGVKAASRLIMEARSCAAGERVCRALFRDAPLTESVFLDELADGMVEAGKARYVTKEEAMETLKAYPGNPLVFSKVSGKYMELCRTWPEKCVYWNMEKRGLKCIARGVGTD